MLRKLLMGSGILTAVLWGSLGYMAMTATVGGMTAPNMCGEDNHGA